MKYNIGEKVYEISIVGFVEEYTVIGKVYHKLFGFTYKTRYCCERLLDKRKRVFNKKEIHRIETE